MSKIKRSISVQDSYLPRNTSFGLCKVIPLLLLIKDWGFYFDVGWLECLVFGASLVGGKPFLFCSLRSRHKKAICIPPNPFQKHFSVPYFLRLIISVLVLSTDRFRECMLFWLIYAVLNGREVVYGYGFFLT